MTSKISLEQVNQIVNNLHHNPFEILGCHQLSKTFGQKKWAIRAYIPEATDVLVIFSEQKRSSKMRSQHHPHFFECEIRAKEIATYQLEIKQDGQTRVIYDPYQFTEEKVTDYDIYLFGQGDHHHIYEKLGTHVTEQKGIKGVFFAVWAPNARNVSVIGDFNSWDGRQYQMRKRQNMIWELFVPELDFGTHYKYEIKNAEGHIYVKSDPFAFSQEVRPKTASIVIDLDSYRWNDQQWLSKRKETDPLTQPIAVYEVHMGSWLHTSMEDPLKQYGEGADIVPASEYKPSARYLNYYELAEKLIPYVKKLGYTHIELLPLAEHPYDGSWGYQVTGYYAPTSRYGRPEDLMYFVDQCHQNDIGIILDWVSGHFPKDAHGLAYFDGTHLFEHEDPRKGEHKGWGTLVFNYGRNEVRNFLLANALFWFEKYHIDGIRVDAVASMLYLDYDREDGEWIPNELGGRENIEAVEFLRKVNQIIFEKYPGIISIAEESTAWAMVSRPPEIGGLGFNLKWNMGWMHDILDYFGMDPWFRQFHQNNITFSMWYHHCENFMLAFSHDEVVHGKSSMIGKMPGDEWQKFANLRTLFTYMYAHPGKKTMFMGMEFAQWGEWNVWSDLEWHLLQYGRHKQLKQFFIELNSLYRNEPALYENDFEEEGFQWIDCSDTRHSVVSFIRRACNSGEFIITVCNFTPQPHSHYRIGVPEAGFYREIFNSDSRDFGGSNMGNLGGKMTDEWFFHNYNYSLDLCLPPLGVLMLKLDVLDAQKNIEIENENIA